MINSRKKGFTLVELVIVIAVIAILAAVLIPTFSNLVKKAKLSADEQAVRQINTLLATEFATEKPETLKEVVDMLDENGYNTDALIPLTKGMAFVWNKETNTISLVPTEKVQNNETLEDGKSYINKEVGTFDQFLIALQNGSDVTLTNDIIIEDAMKVYGDVTIDTKGYKIDASKTGRPFEMTSNSSLVINFGNEIFKTGEFGLIDIKQNVKNVNITINGGKFESQLNWGAFIKIREGADNINITLNDVIYTDTSTDSYIMNCDGFDGSLNLTVNNGKFKSAFGFQINGNATFKNTTIETLGYGIYITKKSTISNCTFKLGNTPEPPQNVPAAAVVVSNQGELTVDNCTVNGEAPYGFVILNSGGTILATNNNITASKDYDLNGGSTGALDSGKTAKIIVDGETRLNR